MLIIESCVCYLFGNRRSGQTRYTSFRPSKHFYDMCGRQRYVIFCVQGRRRSNSAWLSVLLNSTLVIQLMKIAQFAWYVGHYHFLMTVPAS